MQTRSTRMPSRRRRPSRSSNAGARRRSPRRRPMHRAGCVTSAHEMVHLEIVSLRAALSGRGGAITWRGEIPRLDLCRFAPPAALTRATMNAAIVRYFTHVTNHDRTRLERIGYSLPSLHPGDKFAIHGIAFVVGSTSCERISEGPGRFAQLVTHSLR
jgi:hypothetical protein